MEYIHKITEMLCKELKGYGEKQRLGSQDLEMLYKLASTVKNLDKIVKAEEEGYSEGMHDYTYDGASYARGRRRAKRDSMGRYSRDDGYSERYYSDGTSYDRGYSQHKAKDHMLSMLGEMMEDAEEKEREALKECMRAIERA